MLWQTITSCNLIKNSIAKAKDSITRWIYCFPRSSKRLISRMHISAYDVEKEREREKYASRCPASHAHNRSRRLTLTARRVRVCLAARTFESPMNYPLCFHRSCMKRGRISCINNTSDACELKTVADDPDQNLGEVDENIPDRSIENGTISTSLILRHARIYIIFYYFYYLFITKNNYIFKMKKITHKIYKCWKLYYSIHLYLQSYRVWNVKVD